MPELFLLSFRWLSFCMIVFTLVLPTFLLDLFLLYRSLYYARSFGFAFMGFIHMFILLLRIFFSFLPGIAAILGFTSICISIVSVVCFYKWRFFLSFPFVGQFPQAMFLCCHKVPANPKRWITLWACNGKKEEKKKRTKERKKRKRKIE